MDLTHGKRLSELGRQYPRKSGSLCTYKTLSRLVSNTDNLYIGFTKVLQKILEGEYGGTTLKEERGELQKEYTTV